MQPFKRKKKKQALSYFLASTWQNWMKRRERGGGSGSCHRIQARAKEKRGRVSPWPLTFSLSLPIPAAGAESEPNRLSRWSGTPGFFLTVFWFPTLNTLTRPPFLSHGALVSTDQAFNLVIMEDSLSSYAYGTECKKKKGEKKKKK